jgi:DNA-binding transcriptional regulator YiaG
MNLRTYIARDHAYAAAGHVWVVPSVRLSDLPDGTAGLSHEEAGRINRGIVHAICTDSKDLTLDELEFLLDASGATSTELAEHLGIHKSALSKWRSRRSVPAGLLSTALKRFFWFRVFALQIADLQAPLATMASDAALLEYVRSHTAPPDLGASVVHAA